MATNKALVEEMVSHMSGAGDVRFRAMFGEWGVYCDDKFVAIIGDDQLFVKPSAADGAYAGDCQSVPPYPGANEYWLVPKTKWQDSEWLGSFIQDTAAALPLPKKKK